MRTPYLVDVDDRRPSVQVLLKLNCKVSSHRVQLLRCVLDRTECSLGALEHDFAALVEAAQPPLRHAGSIVLPDQRHPLAYCEVSVLAKALFTH